MVATKESVINGALLKLGTTPITIGDGSVADEYSEIAYDTIRDDIQRSYPWKCLIERVELTVDATAPAWGYLYRYALPADCLRIIDLRSFNSTFGGSNYNNKVPAWELESEFLLCDIDENIYLRYIQLETDPEAWDKMLLQVITTALALELCESLTQDETKRRRLERELQQRLIQAASVDSFEGQSRTLNDPGAYEMVRWSPPGTTRSARTVK